MTEPRVPTRWRDDTQDMPNAELRGGLSTYTELGPSEAQRARMLAKLGQLIEAGPSAPLEGSSVKLLLKPWIGVILAVVVGIGWWTLPSETKSPRAAPSASSEAVRTAGAKAAQGLPRPTEPAVPAVLATETTPAKPALTMRARRAPTKVKSLQDPQAELSLLTRARRLLASSPARALELTEEHARSYAHGAFEQEREVLAIEALVQAGRSDAAKARAKAFGRQYPTSAHLERIQIVLQNL